MTLPDPKNYDDGLEFLREMHRLILSNCSAMEKLLNDAEASGVFPSFRTHPEWNELFLFFSRVTPRHEKDEEEFVFPVLSSRLPRMGFQSPEAPIRFLIEGHEVLQAKTIALMKSWEGYRLRERDIASAERSAEEHPTEDAEFVRVGKELVELYRKHIAIEEEKVYKVADKLFKGRDRELLIAELMSVYDNEANTGAVQFTPPQFSDPAYTVGGISTDAIADTEFSFDDSDDDE